jgi:hypothetical protein
VTGYQAGPTRRRRAPELGRAHAIVPWAKYVEGGPIRHVSLLLPVLFSLFIFSFFI